MSKSLTTDDRFDKIDDQFQEMREQFQKVDKRFVSIDNQFKSIDKRFESVNSQFESINSQFESVNKQLDRIATTVVKGFDRIDQVLETKANKADVERMLGLLDAWAKRQEISDDERIVMGHQLDRLNRWVEALAKKIGYKLTY